MLTKVRQLFKDYMLNTVVIFTNICMLQQWNSTKELTIADLCCQYIPNQWYVLSTSSLMALWLKPAYRLHAAMLLPEYMLILTINKALIKSVLEGGGMNVKLAQINPFAKPVDAADYLAHTSSAAVTITVGTYLLSRPMMAAKK